MERVEEWRPDHEDQRIRSRTGENAGRGETLATETDCPGHRVFLWADDQVKLRREAGRTQPEGVLLRFGTVRRYAGHCGVQEPRRELRGLIRVGGEAVGTEDAPDTPFPGDLRRGPVARREEEAPGGRRFQPEHPLVPEVPGAEVEVVAREGRGDEHAAAEAEVAVPGGRGLVPEARDERFGIRPAVPRKHPDGESGRGETELTEVRRAHSFDLPLETERSDVLQQDVHLARGRGRLRAIALGDDESGAVPGQADDRFAGALDLDGEDLGFVQVENRPPVVCSGFFALEQGDPAGDRNSRQQREERRPPHVTGATTRRSRPR